MLQMRFGKANRTGAAHAKGTHPLRNCRFDALSQRILFGKGWRLRPPTGGLKRFMLGLWSHRDGSPLVLLFRAGTAGQQRTAAAISGRELDLDDLVLAMVESRRPAHTRMPLGTSRRLLVPIKAKLTDIDAVIGVGLPFHIRMPGSNHAECRRVAGSRPGSVP